MTVIQWMVKSGSGRGGGVRYSGCCYISHPAWNAGDVTGIEDVYIAAMYVITRHYQD